MHCEKIGGVNMKKYLLSKGFRPETLALLNNDNLVKLAKEYGYKG
jgi:hypothetical protein